MAEPYKAARTISDGIEIVRLVDTARNAGVSVAPSIGHNAYEFTVNGRNIFWVPFEQLSGLARKPVRCGDSQLAPRANRLDQDTLYANGRTFVLNPSLGNLRRNSNGKPIHGLLAFSSHRRIARLEADDKAAVLARRREFWWHPKRMAQFPLAHTTTQDLALDSIFGDLVRDQRGQAEFGVQGVRRKISVGYGPKYCVAVVYAPRSRDFIGFELMTAVTNGLNLKCQGKYDDLEEVPSGGIWGSASGAARRGFEGSAFSGRYTRIRRTGLRNEIARFPCLLTGARLECKRPGPAGNS
ncbi:MAG: hypothetical protein RMK57_05760 [Bryobacterales bacterium]|nr:hypothetical protein [Bryobacteraceae bacterium]MDW8354019.1 hypothetical protein [Bryobacterales bacterium]